MCSRVSFFGGYSEGCLPLLMMNANMLMCQEHSRVNAGLCIRMEPKHADKTAPRHLIVRIVVQKVRRTCDRFLQLRGTLLRLSRHCVSFFRHPASHRGLASSSTV
eukprot:GHVU01148387.1.p1 GENE.GHVU01148387.1~~GHVU01148387.1.p1  ORF type:complete len:105 (-),score=1.58 GHVU01148387.1:6-320(-)